MKPSTLKPGQSVICAGRQMTFVWREKWPRPALNIFQCADYIGLNGPADKGITTMTDAYAARHVELEGGAK